jgi:hypothetical protein
MLSRIEMETSNHLNLLHKIMGIESIQGLEVRLPKDIDQRAVRRLAKKHRNVKVSLDKTLPPGEIFVWVI